MYYHSDSITQTAQETQYQKFKFRNEITSQYNYYRQTVKQSITKLKAETGTL